MNDQDRKVSAIAAMDADRVIGFKGQLPWHVPSDLKHFAASTAKQAVLMGRTTWDTLEDKYRPLPGRTNIVISRNPEMLNLPPGVLRSNNCEETIRDFRLNKIAPDRQHLWVVGGAQIYAQTLPFCDFLVLTLIPGKHQGDTFFPAFESQFEEIERTQLEGCEVVKYARISKQNNQRAL